MCTACRSFGKYGIKSVITIFESLASGRFVADHGNCLAYSVCCLVFLCDVAECLKGSIIFGARIIFRG